jgi:hypothetical protein
VSGIRQNQSRLPELCCPVDVAHAGMAVQTDTTSCLHTASKSVCCSDTSNSVVHITITSCLADGVLSSSQTRSLGAALSHTAVCEVLRLKGHTRVWCWRVLHVRQSLFRLLSETKHWIRGVALMVSFEIINVAPHTDRPINLLLGRFIYFLLFLTQV